MRAIIRQFATDCSVMFQQKGKTSFGFFDFHIDA